jgi:hypothetical protein
VNPARPEPCLGIYQLRKAQPPHLLASNLIFPQVRLSVVGGWETRKLLNISFRSKNKRFRQANLGKYQVRSKKVRRLCLPQLIYPQAGLGTSRVHGEPGSRRANTELLLPIRLM